MSGSDTISPTAHYTGYVWARNGLSHPALATAEGRVLFASLAPAMAASRRIGGPSLERYLLARHRAIDARVQGAIESGVANQVLEVAAGLSPRGWRLSQLYGDRVTYVEADLPAMAQRKRQALARIGSLSAHHEVRDVDALKPGGPGSLAELIGELDPDRGLIIITEGLLGYLATEDVTALWRRFAAVLRRFSAGRYVSDLHLGDAQTAVVRGFRVLLSAFVRGRVHLHFDGAQEAEAALLAAGFAQAEVLPAAGRGSADSPRAAQDRGSAHGQRSGGGAQMAHILEAST
ncbi:MAG: class I SAM-dependent methyltransferase [Actinomycetota bacterium]|nr:class I SAM-dependent methyltransferase [Actinomycetota bacterium]